MSRNTHTGIIFWLFVELLVVLPNKESYKLFDFVGIKEAAVVYNPIESLGKHQKGYSTALTHIVRIQVLSWLCLPSMLAISSG